ncbi:hypothetical protein [Marinomonas sp. 2405UD68-3]|uniref:hypothetical protein n=1 Tax=Marinomonas sp. 2405UD68-3 TaxID=3391835 RepID=UPI0039C9385F
MEAGLLVAADRANLISSIRANTTPAASSTSNGQNDSTTPPSVRVDLSDTARQLAVESQQRNSVQETNESEPTSPRSVREASANTEVLSVGEENSTPSATEVTRRNLNDPLTNSTVSNTERNTDTEERSASVNTTGASSNDTQAVETAPPQPVRTNQNASLVTQYNVTPDSIIGQSISIQA